MLKEQTRKLKREQENQKNKMKKTQKNEKRPRVWSFISGLTKPIGQHLLSCVMRQSSKLTETKIDRYSISKLNMKFVNVSLRFDNNDPKKNTNKKPGYKSSSFEF